MQTRRLKKYWFTDRTLELRAMAGVVVIFALLVSFNQWGAEDFSAKAGLFNFAWSVFAIGLSFLVVDSCRRLYSIKRGVRYQLQVWWYGMGLSALITIASAGAIKIFMGPTFWLENIPGYRIGAFPRSRGTQDFGRVGLLGFLMHFVMADLAAMGWFSWMPLVAVNNMIVFNLVYACLMLLPLPPLDGSKIFYYLFGYSGMMYTLPGILMGIALGYLVGWSLGLAVGMKYLCALIGGIVGLTYFEKVFPAKKD